MIKFRLLTALSVATISVWALAVHTASGVTSDATSAAPAAQVPVVQGNVAVFAGGCFWGMEGLFEHVRGVKQVTAGYAGGKAADANYPAVSSERTRHAESVRIVYDPDRVSYTQLLGIFFTVAHDPTQINGQYPDMGTSYRSAIFPQSNVQRRMAEAYIASLNRSGKFGKPIATQVESGEFFAAEPEHQQFMRRNPNYPYIVMWDRPRLEKLRTIWPQLYSG